MEEKEKKGTSDLYRTAEAVVAMARALTAAGYGKVKITYVNKENRRSEKE